MRIASRRAWGPDGGWFLKKYAIEAATTLQEDCSTTARTRFVGIGMKLGVFSAHVRVSQAARMLRRMVENQVTLRCNRAMAA